MPVAEAIGNPWVTIWTQPRATVRRIVDADVRYHVVSLAVLWGALSRLELRWSQAPTGSIWPLMVVASVILGAIGGVVVLYIASAMLKWSGSALGGVATHAQVRAAYAWSHVPIIVGVSIGIASILLGTGGPMFSRVPDSESASATVSILQSVFAIWTFVVILKTVGEVHRFSAWRTLASMGLIVVAGIVAVLMMYLLARGVGTIFHPAFTM
jgi:hypothetical protein